MLIWYIPIKFWLRNPNFSGQIRDSGAVSGTFEPLWCPCTGRVPLCPTLSPFSLSWHVWVVPGQVSKFYQFSLSLLQPNPFITPLRPPFFLPPPSLLDPFPAFYKASKALGFEGFGMGSPKNLLLIFSEVKVSSFLLLFYFASLFSFSCVIFCILLYFILIGLCSDEHFTFSLSVFKL